MAIREIDQDDGHEDSEDEGGGDSDEDSEDVVVMMREKRPQLFVALGKIDQPCASHSQAV